MALPLTKDWLVARYLTGVDLTDDSGTPYPEEQFWFALAAAVEWAKTTLDIEIEQRTVIERHDWSEQVWDQRSLLQMKRAPVAGIGEIRFLYANRPLLTVPPEWVVEVCPGQIQLLPLSSIQFQGSPAVASIPFLGSPLGGASNVIPGYFEVSYQAGFPSWSIVRPGSGAYTPPVDFGGVVAFSLSAPAPLNGTTFAIVGSSDDGGLVETVTIPAGQTGPVAARRTWESITTITPGNLPVATPTWAVRAARIPADILHLIGMYAACFPLNIAGDLIAGAGIASRSTSVDGLSSSVGTTASATNSGYGSRILIYVSEIKRLLPVVRRRYHGFSLRVG